MELKALKQERAKVKTQIASGKNGDKSALIKNKSLLDSFITLQQAAALSKEALAQKSPDELAKIFSALVHVNPQDESLVTFGNKLVEALENAPPEKKAAFLTALFCGRQPVSEETTTALRKFLSSDSLLKILLPGMNQLLKEPSLSALATLKKMIQDPGIKDKLKVGLLVLNREWASIDHLFSSKDSSVRKARYAQVLNLSHLQDLLETDEWNTYKRLFKDLSEPQSNDPQDLKDAYAAARRAVDRKEDQAEATYSGELSRETGKLGGFLQRIGLLKHITPSSARRAGNAVISLLNTRVQDLSSLTNNPPAFTAHAIALQEEISVLEKDPTFQSLLTGNATLRTSFSKVQQALSDQASSFINLQKEQLLALKEKPLETFVQQVSVLKQAVKTLTQNLKLPNEVKFDGPLADEEKFRYDQMTTHLTGCRQRLEEFEGTAEDFSKIQQEYEERLKILEGNQAFKKLIGENQDLGSAFSIFSDFVTLASKKHALLKKLASRDSCIKSLQQLNPLSADFFEEAAKLQDEMAPVNELDVPKAGTTLHARYIQQDESFMTELRRKTQAWLENFSDRISKIPPLQEGALPDIESDVFNQPVTLQEELLKLNGKSAFIQALKDNQQLKETFENLKKRLGDLISSYLSPHLAQFKQRSNAFREKSAEEADLVAFYEFDRSFMALKENPSFQRALVTNPALNDEYSSIKQSLQSQKSTFQAAEDSTATRVDYGGLYELYRVNIGIDVEKQPSKSQLYLQMRKAQTEISLRRNKTDLQKALNRYPRLNAKVTEAEKKLTGKFQELFPLLVTELGGKLTALERAGEGDASVYTELALVQDCISQLKEDPVFKGPESQQQLQPLKQKASEQYERLFSKPLEDLLKAANTTLDNKPTDDQLFELLGKITSLQQNPAFTALLANNRSQKEAFEVLKQRLFTATVAPLSPYEERLRTFEGTAAAFLVILEEFESKKNSLWRNQTFNTFLEQNPALGKEFQRFSAIDAEGCRKYNLIGALEFRDTVIKNLQESTLQGEERAALVAEITSKMPLEETDLSALEENPTLKARYEAQIATFERLKTQEGRKPEEPPT